MDTQIHHITPPIVNLFAELGLTPADAAQFQAQSLKQVGGQRLHGKLP
jgi:hypothetical protein